MPRCCIILHNPAEETAKVASSHWLRTLTQGLHARGDSVVWLVTGTPDAKAREALAKTAGAQRVSAQLLAEFAPERTLPLLPPTPPHRTGMEILAALRELRCDAALFVGNAEHAAAAVEARRCGTALAGCRLGLLLATTRPLARARAGVFPEEGRNDIAADALERRALCNADAVLAGDAETADWITRETGRAAERTTLLHDGESFSAKELEALAGKDSRGATEAKVETAVVVAPPSTPPKSRARVSVCVPFYQHGDALCAALDTLAAQDEAPDEVIVVDDGSPDLAAIDKARTAHARPGWRFLRQENAGPSAARNRAAREATGDLLVFCDADNLFRPGMIATLRRALERTGAVAATCAFEAFRENTATGERVAEYILAPLGDCAELGLLENCIGDTNFMVRREVFLARGGFPAGNRSASEDWQFLLGLLAAGHALVSVPEVLFDYRLADQSHSHRLTEWDGASAALSEMLAGMPAPWRRLWPHLAGMIRQPAARQAAASAEAARASLARAQAEHLATERAQRLQIARMEAHTRDLNALVETVSTARAKALEELLALRAKLATTEQELEGRRDKVQRMENSFSWKATAPLRSLRRLFVDDKRKTTAVTTRGGAEASPGGGERAGTEPKGARFRHHLDAPRSWKASEAEITVRGWCLREDNTPLAALRVRVDGREYPGVTGIPRPDLPLALPDFAQAGRSGFQADIRIHPEDTKVSLEACDANGEWNSFLTVALGDDSPLSPGSYAHWVALHDTHDEAGLAALRAAAAAWPVRPRISLLMPVYNTPERWLRRVVETVRAQTYTEWELCIADDASPAPHVRPLLDELAAADARIRVTRLPANGHICAATNAALALATGELCALLDHDDELAPHALHCIVSEFLLHPGTEFVYSDEDKIDETGERFDPHFKPDWNPDLLNSQNYICHLAALRTAKLRELGGLRPGLEGSQDWDLFLRLSEGLPTAAVRHVPRILYHWRAISGSTALRVSEKDYISDSAHRALSEHFARLGVAATLDRTPGGHWHVRWPLPDRPPLVSIIIPTKNGAALVRQCIASITGRTTYTNYEILLVDNRSDAPEALAYFEELGRRDNIRVVRYDQPFNYSAINNYAAAQARGELLCLLNNDIEVIAPDWLGEMVAQALRPEIGAVGARLYYPDSRIQHAGVITGLGGVAGHAFKHFAKNEPGMQFRPHLTHNLSAVTAACLVVRRSVYMEVNGLDEQELAVAFNDVDFCLRIRERGYRNLYTPAAELFHHESASRGAEDSPEKVRRFQGEIAAIKRRWGDSLLADPAYNPNLSLDSEDFALAYPPRVPSLT